MALIDEIRFLGDNPKGKFFLVFFRLSSRCNNLPRALFPFTFFVRRAYRITIRWVLGIDIPDKTLIGWGFNVQHGMGLVIHGKVKIGQKVTVRHNTTIGKSHPDGGTPTIGDNVDIGANSVIIGDITVGDNVKIGAGSVVVKSIPPNSTVVGNPARILRRIIA